MKGADSKYILIISIFTITGAIIFSSFVHGISQQVFCNGAAITFAATYYPKWSYSDNSIVAVVEAKGKELKGFKFFITLNDGSTLTLDDITGHIIPAGSIGDIKTASLSIEKSDIKTVRITSNCNSASIEDSLKY